MHSEAASPRLRGLHQQRCRFGLLGQAATAVFVLGISLYGRVRPASWRRPMLRWGVGADDGFGWGRVNEDEFADRGELAPSIKRRVEAERKAKAEAYASAMEHIRFADAEELKALEEHEEEGGGEQNDEGIADHLRTSTLQNDVDGIREMPRRGAGFMAKKRDVVAEAHKASDAFANLIRDLGKEQRMTKEQKLAREEHYPRPDTSGMQYRAPTVDHLGLGHLVDQNPLMQKPSLQSFEQLKRAQKALEVRNRLASMGGHRTKMPKLASGRGDGAGARAGPVGPSPESTEMVKRENRDSYAIVPLHPPKPLPIAEEDKAVNPVGMRPFVGKVEPELQGRATVSFDFTKKEIVDPMAILFNGTYFDPNVNIDGEEEIEVDDKAVREGVTKRMVAASLLCFRDFLSSGAHTSVLDDVDLSNIDPALDKQISATIEFIKQRFEPFEKAREEKRKLDEKHSLFNRRMDWIQKNIHTGEEDLQRRYVLANSDWQQYAQYMAELDRNDKRDRQIAAYKAKLAAEEAEKKDQEEIRKFNAGSEERAKALRKRRAEEKKRKALERKRQEWERDSVGAGPMAQGLGPGNPHFKGFFNTNQDHSKKEESVQVGVIGPQLPSKQEMSGSKNSQTNGPEESPRPTNNEGNSGSEGVEKNPLSVREILNLESMNATTFDTPPPTPFPKMDRLIFTGFGTVVDVDEVNPEKKKKRNPKKELEEMLQQAFKTAKAKLRDNGVKYPPEWYTSIPEAQRRELLLERDESRKLEEGKIRELEQEERRKRRRWRHEMRSRRLEELRQRNFGKHFSRGAAQ